MYGASTIAEQWRRAVYTIERPNVNRKCTTLTTGLKPCVEFSFCDRPDNFVSITMIINFCKLIYDVIRCKDSERFRVKLWVVQHRQPFSTLRKVAAKTVSSALEDTKEPPT